MAETEYEAKLKAREQQARDDDQVNLTDPDSRIMPIAGGGFEQCYNAQAAVDTDTMLIVATHLTQAANDQRQLVPVLSALNTLPEELGEVTRLLADSGYCSAANVTACERARAVPGMPCESRPSNQCSGVSNRSWAGDSSCCEGARRYAANGR